MSKPQQPNGVRGQSIGAMGTHPEKGHKGDIQAVQGHQPHHSQWAGRARGGGAENSPSVWLSTHCDAAGLGLGGGLDYYQARMAKFKDTNCSSDPQVIHLSPCAI